MRALIDWLIWALIDNDDEPNPPADKWPDESVLRRGVKWWLRNPFHNLAFYVIGLADRDFERVAVFPKDAPGNLVFYPTGGWYIAITKYKWVRLPFISYQGKGIVQMFYVGWRERANLGAKLDTNWRKQ